jgi:hypothetical protein
MGKFVFMSFTDIQEATESLKKFIYCINSIESFWHGKFQVINFIARKSISLGEIRTMESFPTLSTILSEIQLKI